MAGAMVGKEVEKGQIIIKQGEVDADEFYVIGSGSVSFHVTEDDGGFGPEDDCGSFEPIVQHIGTAGPGGNFGEIALMYDCPRTATCRAEAPTQLYKLNRKLFRHFRQVSVLQKFSDREAGG